MRRPARALAPALLTSVAVMACGDTTRAPAEAVAAIELHFGMTEFLFVPQGEKANDYLPDFPAALRAAASTCRVRLLGLNGAITDGGEAAYFAPGKDANATAVCLRRAISQGRVEAISAGTWGEWSAQGWTPMPVPGEWPSAMPPPP